MMRRMRIPIRVITAQNPRPIGAAGTGTGSGNSGALSPGRKSGSSSSMPVQRAHGAISIRASGAKKGDRNRQIRSSTFSWKCASRMTWKHTALVLCSYLFEQVFHHQPDTRQSFGADLPDKPGPVDWICTADCFFECFKFLPGHERVFHPDNGRDSPHHLTYGPDADGHFYMGLLVPVKILILVSFGQPGDLHDFVKDAVKQLACISSCHRLMFRDRGSLPR